MSSRNRRELFEAENRTIRKVRQRHERHAVRIELASARGMSGAAELDIEPLPVAPPSHHHHPDAWHPKQRRVWRLPFWKRRNNVRAEKNRQAQAVRDQQ